MGYYLKIVVLSYRLLPCAVLCCCFIFSQASFYPGLYAGDADAVSESETPGGVKETTALLAEIPENSRILEGSLRFRPEDGLVAYVYESEEGFRVCINDQCAPYVDRVARGMPVVSPNGKHLAAVVQTEGDTRVMLDGNIGKACDMVYGLRFSPDSMILTYIAQKDDAFSVYVNQEQHRSFAMIDPEQGLVFSPDSNHLAYVASDDGSSWRMVHNGKPGEAFEQIKHITFSPDSNRLIYAAKSGGKWHIVENGEIQGAGYVDIKRIRFSPDSGRLVYVARDDAGAFLVEDGKKSDVFDYIPGEPVFSSDGDRLAYAVAEEARRGDVRMRMVLDEEIGPAFEQIGAYRFSPDGQNFAYMAVKNDAEGMMVYNGEEGDAYQSVGIPVFSTEGKGLAYYVRNEGQWHIKANGEKGPAFSHVENPVFSPSGDRMVYTAVQDASFMVIEGGETVGGTYEFVAYPTFSPDGKHLAYSAVQEGQAFLVVDGKKGEESFLSFVKGAPLVFTEERAVQGIAVRAYGDGRQEFWLIRAEIEK